MSNQIENFMKMTKTYTKTQKNFTKKQNHKYEKYHSQVFQGFSLLNCNNVVFLVIQNVKKVLQKN